MAESVISTDITRGTITAESGVTFSELSVVQIDKAVYIRGYASLSTAASQNTEKKLGTISGVALPKSAVRTLCGTTSGAAYTARSSGYLVIASNGNFAVNTSQTGQTIFTFCLSYSIL